MEDDNKDQNGNSETKIIVEAKTIDGIIKAIGLDPTESAEPATSSHHEKLDPILETLNDIYEGVEQATKDDSRGRSRKIIRQYANREDLNSDLVGHYLRVLETHDLVVQDGNRWRIADQDNTEQMG